MTSLAPGLLAQIVALTHTVDGVTLELHDHDGGTLIAARHRLDAHLDPCQLRHVLLHELASDRPRLLRSITDARITAGLEEVGAGIYQRRSPSCNERWFATSISSTDVGELFADCPVELPESAVRVTARPDLELGVTVVGIGANHPAYEADLDGIATWAIGAAMVLELIVSVQTAGSTGGGA